MKPEEDKSNDIPAWVVSFTDMITLLLSFFVMLQAFAHVQDPNLFYEGQGSFRRAVHGLGIPQWLLGRREGMKRDFFIKRHAVEPSELTDDAEPILDEEQDLISQAMEQLRRRFNSAADKISQRTFDVTAAPFRFSGVSTRLDGAAMEYLDDMAQKIAQTRRPGNSTVYIIGLGPDVQSKSQAYVVGAQRAEAVRHYLQGQLDRAARGWKVICWGGGQSFGTLPAGTQVGIVVTGV
jgi:outer membrane protein OmpA-like peptidoglycan-associated protein